MRVAPGSKGKSSEALRLSNSTRPCYTIVNDGGTYYAEVVFQTVQTLKKVFFEMPCRKRLML